MRKVHRAYLGLTRISHCGVTLLTYTQKTDSTADNTRPWVESDVCRLTVKCYGTIFFQKAYFNSLQGNKNWQICAPFTLVKDRMLSASGVICRLTPTRGSVPGPPLGAPPPDPIIGLR